MEIPRSWRGGPEDPNFLLHALILWKLHAPPDTPLPYPQAYNHFETSGQPPNMFFPDCPAQLAPPDPSLFKLRPPAQWDPQVSLGLTRKPHLVPGASKLPSHPVHPVPSPPPLSVPAICPHSTCHLCGCLFWHPHSRKMGFFKLECGPTWFSPAVCLSSFLVSLCRSQTPGLAQAVLSTQITALLPSTWLNLIQYVSFRLSSCLLPEALRSCTPADESLPEQWPSLARRSTSRVGTATTGHLGLVPQHLVTPSL